MEKIDLKVEKIDAKMEKEDARNALNVSHKSIYFLNEHAANDSDVSQGECDR